MLAALEHALNVLRHDLTHALDLALRRPQRILLARDGAALLRHHLLQRRIEGGAAVGRQLAEGGAGCGKVGEEGFFEVREEAERDALAQLALRDYEEGETAGGRGRGVVGGRLYGGVDEELLLVDCAVGRGIVLDLREDERDEAACVG